MSRVRRKPDRQDHFEVVVPLLPADEADEAFSTWLAAQDLRRDDLSPRDVIVDTSRSRDGQVRKTYRVYRYAFR